MTDYEKIYQMQRDLNILVGRDTVEDPKKIGWLFDYSQALDDEVSELRNCINWKWWAKEAKEFGQYSIILDLENAKIEAIDALHFIISLIQIANIDITKFGQDPLKHSLDHFTKLYRAESTDNVAQDLFKATESLAKNVRLVKDCTNWEHANNLNDIRIKYFDTLEISLQNIWDDLMKIFVILNLKTEDVVKIYELKYEKNVERQENDYSVLSKTEDDNNEVKTRM